MPTEASSANLRSQDLVADAAREAMLEHAREDYAKKPSVEACGFIATNGNKQKAVRSPNRDSKPENNFTTSAKTWREVEDSGWQIIAAYHSHNNTSAVPSPGDKAWSEKVKLPFVIIGMPSEVFGFYAPTGHKAELLGRPFVSGVQDCLTLARDYYEEKHGIVIPDFEYDADWWKPKGDKPGLNLYVDNIEKAGFVEVPTAKPDDLFLIQIPPSPVANHCAIYLGDAMIMHHLSGRLSRREPYAEGVGYARAVQKIVRHKSLFVE